jgi:hypothetical protein
MTVVGAWSIPPAIALFVYYARADHFVTRYLTDFYPAFAAATLCIGASLVEAVGRRAPQRVASARLAIAALAGLYVGLGRGWPTHLSHPNTREEVLAQIRAVDEHTSQPLPPLASLFECGEAQRKQPVHSHFGGWKDDCSFFSGVIFAMPHAKCVTFTFLPGSGQWDDAEQESLADFRVRADFDSLAACGKPVVDGDKRQLTMCETRPPRFLLEGMRLYCIASLDRTLEPLDKLKLLRVEAAPACP